MLKIYNTKTNKKQELKPLKNKDIRMYVCGPTVYDYDHLGHARVGIFYDIVRRYLIHLGYNVKFVQNITDVGHLTESETGEDKIIKKAKQVKKTPKEIARFYEKTHFEDMKALNILKPDYSPRASNYIKEIIEFIQKLINKGYAYQAKSGVYFNVSRFKNYGKLSKRNFDQEMIGEQEKIKQDKKNPRDFVLWVTAKPEHLMQWDSPWSRGYPGWHIECSVMNREILGDTIDIHGGAIELAFPHHENEIAQSESLTGQEFVKNWVHIGLLNINGQKMSKSKGNFIYIKDALKKYHADTIRIVVMMTQYRKPIDWTQNVIDQAESIRKKLIMAKKKNKKGPSIIQQKVDSALANDFNTPKSLEIMLRNLNKLTNKDYNYLEDIFGLKLQKDVIPAKAKKLAQLREKSRQDGDYKEADKIRQKINELGFEIEDTKDGYRIEKN